MGAEIDLPHLQTWIGRTETAEDVISPRLEAEYRATLHPHLAPVADGDAPLALHWCLSPVIAAAAELGPDGHPKRGGFLPPVPLPRRMWAGGTVETFGPLRTGDRVTRRSTVTDVSLKTGRTGPLCFVAVRHDYLSERGLAVSERHDIVYRDAVRPEAVAGGAVPTPPLPDPRQGGRADLTWEVEATPVLLFRYSALTFNGHRIHYDAPYVTGVEGYGGLVVHGPLQASLLFNLAARLLGQAPTRFDYRGLSPLTAGQTFRVSAWQEDGGAASCRTLDAMGRTCMEATAGR